MSEDTTFTWVYGKPKLVMKTFVYSQKMKISLTSLVVIVLEERIVGHVPKNMSKISHRYMTIPGNEWIVKQVMVLRFLSSANLLVPKKQLNGQKREVNK